MSQHAEFSWEDARLPQRGLSRVLSLFVLCQPEAYHRREKMKAEVTWYLYKYAEIWVQLSAAVVSGECSWTLDGCSSSVLIQAIDWTQLVQQCCMLHWILLQRLMYMYILFFSIQIAVLFFHWISLPKECIGKCTNKRKPNVLK